jgi:hypothetical protein
MNKKISRGYVISTVELREMNTTWGGGKLSIVFLWGGGGGTFSWGKNSITSATILTGEAKKNKNSCSCVLLRNFHEKNPLARTRKKGAKYCMKAEANEDKKV